MNVHDLVPVIAQEEAAEVIQAISKCLRFGVNHRYNAGLSNKEKLEIEVGQLLYMVQRLINEWHLDSCAMTQAYNDKEATYSKWENHFPKDQDD